MFMKDHRCSNLIDCPIVYTEINFPKRSETKSSQLGKLHLVPDALDVDPFKGPVRGEEVTVMLSRKNWEVWRRRQLGSAHCDRVRALLAVFAPFQPTTKLPSSSASPLTLSVRAKPKQTTLCLQPLQSHWGRNRKRPLISRLVDFTAGKDVPLLREPDQLVDGARKLHLCLHRLG